MFSLKCIGIQYSYCQYRSLSLEYEYTLPSVYTLTFTLLAYLH